MMRLARWTSLVGILLAATWAQAGTIDPALQADLDRTSPETPISVIVHMSEQAPITMLSQQLQATKATRMERHRTIVTALQEASSGQEELRSWLDQRMRSGEVIGYTSYWISNMVVVYATKAEIERIADRADVDLIESNFTVSLIEPIGSRPPLQPLDEEVGLRGIGVTNALRAMHAPEVWNQLGYTGAGRLVANCDTGVMGSHPAYQTRWRGYNGQHPWQECWLDLLGTGTQFPTDTHGHGTHVMGTECGLGAATEDTVGVAWGAQWIATNPINQGVGSAFDNDIITAYQWFADPDGDPETVDDVPDVVQNSWRINENFGGNYTDCDDRWWDAIDNCEASGVVTTWSAGNEGPGGTSIGSPADRATTTLNTLSVGSVNATDYDWPYPISSFSSRGPTGCNVPAEQKLKPEVVAPGENVYSSVNNGGYQGGWNGTSMAGPHVAGMVGLIREANPNLSVEDVKQIILDTARDEGTVGEDNTFGWGFIDAYAAVIAATVGFGNIEGTVTNASWGDVPIEDAQVKLLDVGTRYFTDANGHYSGSGPAGLHTVEASHPSFQSESTEVELVSNELVVVNFSLTDIAGPTITDVTEEVTTTDTVGPYTIQASVFDYSTVAGVKLFNRINGGVWAEMPMNPVGPGVYEADLPGRPAGTQIDYYVWAEDGIGLESTSPLGAPLAYYSLYITEEIYTYDAEADAGWQLGATGDDATTGVWIRDDPVGTEYNGQPVQPEDDHTADPGVICFVTGNGAVGGAAGDQDVDGGCTTLLSPLFDLSEAELAFVTYHRWYGQSGNAVDDEFAVDVSSNGGTNWIPLERVPGNQNSWQKVTLRIDTLVNLTDQVRFRFQACDLGSGGLVEAAIDDVSLETFIPNAADVADNGLRVRTALAQNEPNPFNPKTTIRFTLSNPADARLVIYDASGRALRTLIDGRLHAGAHHVVWDGRDEEGRSLGSGVYFYKLKAGRFEQSRRMTILK